MACKIICDNCGKEQRLIITSERVFKAPTSWYGSGQGEDFEIVCSLECADKLEEKKNES